MNLHQLQAIGHHQWSWKEGARGILLRAVAHLLLLWTLTLRFRIFARIHPSQEEDLLPLLPPLMITTWAFGSVTTGEH